VVAGEALVVLVVGLQAVVVPVGIGNFRLNILFP